MLTTLLSLAYSLLLSVTRLDNITERIGIQPLFQDDSTLIAMGIFSEDEMIQSDEVWSSPRPLRIPTTMGNKAVLTLPDSFAGKMHNAQLEEEEEEDIRYISHALSSMEIPFQLP
ncbi:hypothetical protein BXZ70DRAFT_740935 [Cristinia sonorae]|uniref:Uncharacterized protein n=1 Tax=Cristinia sonorae TaxID=1940300 RepID=A0A8K0UTL1_9AGAR|nr:hypothetical protein BXZ70DRAFT_740935 [Cristinia sonorae]